MASSDTGDDVILIGVLLLGAFVNECRKKIISANIKAFGLWTGRWIEQREKQPFYQAKSKQTTTANQRSLSVFNNLLHRLEQVAI